MFSTLACSGLETALTAFIGAATFALVALVVFLFLTGYQVRQGHSEPYRERYR